MMRRLAAGLAAVVLAAWGAAQAPAQANGIDRIAAEQFQARGRALLEEARKSPEGMAVAIMQKSPGHYAELVARVKTGGAEVHADWDDAIMMIDGDATELTGGAVVEPKDTAPGEIRGARLNGPTGTTPVHKGDLVQIAAKTRHQMVLPAGKTAIYLVIKVQVPK